MPVTEKSCLLITYGPVPTPQYQTVEGGGMRVWGLAQGLLANGIDVTVGVNNSFPQELTEHEGVRLTNWGLDAEFVQQLNSYDAVLISYCLGDPSVFVADNINDSVQLILDAYVPIYIEVSARDSKDVETEYSNYMADIQRHNRVLRRGDYFLYANPAQELLYSGVLSALGVINPRSYREKRLIQTPFGIHHTPATAHKNPYTELGVKPADFVVLWFGGIYPWFRIEEYLAAVKQLASDKTIKFVFVGGKNPFNPNPDFSRQYDAVVAFAAKEKLTGKQVYFIDWVDFDDRIDWYTYSDVIVSINQPGEENKYSWRTRVMDYIWGEVVTISNGGDPLSEELIASGAAVRLTELSTDAIVQAVLTVKTNPAALKAMKQQVIGLKQKYFWDVVTKEVSQLVQAGNLPYTRELALRSKVLPASVDSQNDPTATLPAGRATTLASLPLKVARKIKQKGVVRTAKIASSVVKTHLKNTPNKRREPQYIFISNPIENNGAPVVLLQIITEYVHKYGPNRVRLLAPAILVDDQKAYLRKLGVQVDTSVFGIGFRFIRLQLNLQKNDVVFMNTAAIYDNYRDFVLLWLRNKRLNHAYWFIHEDIAQLPFIHKEFLDKGNIKQVAKLVKSDSLSLLFPSRRTAEEYKVALGIDQIHTVNLHVEVAEKYRRIRNADEFETIDFLLSGTSSDGRKGQLLALSAFNSFVKDYQEKHPERYRSFRLHLVAIKEDYVSQQIRWISDSTLSGQVKIYGTLPKDEALEVTSKCNAVICCSLNETFGLSVAESMLMGHVVLRNNSSGMEEQLIDGENGLFIDHTDIPKFAAAIEIILNKDKTSNEQLAAMGKRSQEIITAYGENSYISQIEAV